MALVLPPSPVVVIAEKVRYRLGRSPTMMLGPACPARMSTPLVAMSGGVCGDHWLPPDGSMNSCQNWLAPDAAPIGTAAQVAPGPVSAVVRESGTAGELGVCAGRVALSPAAPAACGRRTATQAMDSTAKTARMISPWCSSAARNAATTVGSSTFRPLFIPGMAPVTSRPTGLHHPVRPGDVNVRRDASDRRET